MTSGELRQESFNLLRSFAFLSLICIVLISAVSALLLSRFLKDNLLQRDAVVTMEFVQSIAQTQNTSAYFAELDYGKSKAALEEFFRRIAHMPDVARANVFAQDGTVIWSNNEQLIGQTFKDNPELDRALAGELVLKTGKVKAAKKAEHVKFGADVDQFVENYIPIRDPKDRAVVGVVEVYKIPRVLLASIVKGNMLIGISSLLGSALLYATLFWIVHRARGVIDRQQHALVESEKMAAVGEMASAVAHGIRNPLAAIRSSAELALEEARGPVKEFATDITTEVDRLERWVRELLTYTRNQGEPGEAETALANVVRTSLDNFGGRLERQGIEADLQMGDALPLVRGNPNLLVQVLNSVIANALEAMPNGGRLKVIGERLGAAVSIKVTDTGAGISEKQLREVFKPLVTHKPNGLGVGLPLARRTLQRLGGNLELFSREGTGTTAQLTLPAAS